jgi:hypothetical protein
MSVMGFTVHRARIVQINALLDPDRLARLPITVPALRDDLR